MTRKAPRGLLNKTTSLQGPRTTALTKAMFTRDRSEMDPTLFWNGPFLLTRHRSAYQSQATRDRSVMVRH